MTRSTGWTRTAAARTVLLVGGLLFPAATPEAAAQTPPVAAQTPASTAQAPGAQTAATAGDGGTIHGTVKAGAVPLPGVAITATNTLTNKKYATTTDVDGNYSMAIPAGGRYVVRAELAAFAAPTQEVRITAEATNQTAAFAMELASRAAPAAVTAANAPATGAGAVRTPGQGGGQGGGGQRGAGGFGGARATQQGRGTQSLAALGLDADLTDATLGGAAGSDVSVPSLGGLSDLGNAASNDAVAISGNQGITNGLAGINEDDLRNRVQDAMNRTRDQGGAAGDQMNSVVSLLGGIMQGGPGFGGPGGGGPGGGGPGGGRGGRGGAGGGGGFRNFNPAQPHGNVFYQGGNSSLNSAPWQPSLVAQTNPAAYQNRFGLSLTGTPYIPGLTKPDTRQFAFINITGQRNLNAFAPTPVRVPTLAERAGNFAQSQQTGPNGTLVPVTIFDPVTGTQFGGSGCQNMSPVPAGCNVVPTGRFSPQALALLNYYPSPNINLNSTDPSVYNYQTIANAGSNNIAINTRYQRQLGQAQAPRGGGRGQGGGGFRGQRPNPNAPPVLRQNINAAYNYSHSASDNRNIFLPLGGKTESDGNGLNLGYTVSYGRISNNASLNWNRSSGETSNYFTDTSNNPTATAGLNVPNQAQSFADPRFYNGLPSIGLTSFASFSNQTPSETINQTIAFSDFVAWRHAKHNYRFGVDIRRIHADSIGGNNPLGTYTFSGYATANPADQVAGVGAGLASGSSFADFLLGLPLSTAIQAPLNKIYLRENVYDLYAQDDFRVKSNVTLNYGLRYEYFGPYSEKNGHIVNLDHNADFTAFDRVLAGGTSTYNGTYSNSLVNPDHALVSPRIGFAYSPRFKDTKNVVIRGGYGINYNTGQYAVFARSLSHQVPFAATQNNAAPTPTKANATPAATGCTTTQSAYTYTTSSGATATRPATTANLLLSGGFGCSTANAISNTYAVDKNYRLGMVQIYNLNIQKTLPLGIVLNVGYNGSKGSNLDVVGTPNGTPNGTTTPGVAAFDYETSAAESRSNSLVVQVQQRQRKGIALGGTYTYSHTIDNASGVGGAVGTPVQNFYRLDLEEGNSTFDQRHNLTGTYLIELPFGPNREFLNKGGVMAKILDGYSISGSFTFASGLYFTPTYSNNQAEASAANTFNQRPNRVAGQSIIGPGRVKAFFNTAAFSAPAAGQYGNASQGSIEGPGTLAVNTALSRTVTLSGTNSFEARVQATNVFNTVQYSSINVSASSNNFGQVTSAAQMRSLLFVARYRF